MLMTFNDYVLVEKFDAKKAYVDKKIAETSFDFGEQNLTIDEKFCWVTVTTKYENDKVTLHKNQKLLVFSHLIEKVEYIDFDGVEKELTIIPLSSIVISK